MKIKSNYLLLFSLFICCACASEPAQNLTGLKLDSVKTINADVQQNQPVLVQIDTAAADSQPNKKARPAFKSPEIKFEKTSHDFGTIKQGETREYNFEFSNTGDKPLEISKVEGSCGCTVGSYPFLPISKNEKNIITARFDSKGKINKQETYLLIHSNAADSPHKLILKALVE